MIFFTIGTLGWVWAISTSLNDKLPLDSKLNIKVFRILFLIPIIYILLLTLGLDYILNEGDGNGGLFGVIIILHLFSMFCIFYGLRFAAKTMKSVELGRNAKFGDYAGEFFLMWFSFIGYWVLQPRLNKLIK
ncbi:hypothetical protein [Lutibacter agarilyticus]|nr:hypothetical protein [Lutibacter agarilyticus]